MLPHLCPHTSNLCSLQRLANTTLRPHTAHCQVTMLDECVLELYDTQETIVWEHSVILTLPIDAVDDAQTPDRRCRYT